MPKTLGKNNKSSHNDNCIIRQANLTDLDSITHCIKVSYEPYISKLGMTPNALKANYAEIINNKNLYIAEIQQNVVGTIEIKLNKEHITIEKLSVLPFYRGNKIGVKMISFAESLAKEHNLKKLILFTHQLLNDNINFFRNYGFIETERRSENGFNRVYFEKTIKE